MADRISGILFDIGGVLVALDGVPSLAALLEIDPDHETLHKLWITSPSVIAHETGKVSAADFAAGVVGDLNLATTPEAFLQDFSNWPRAVHVGAFQLLDDIPSTYRVAALSNTSAVHWDRITELGLADRFKMRYLSHETGYLKPDPEAFLLALNGMGLSCSEVLFLDDGMGNVNAARGLGIHAHLTRDPREARQVLEEYGIVSLDHDVER